MSMFDRQKATLRLQNVDANQIIAGITSTFKLKVEKYGGHIETFLGAKESTVNVDEMHFTNVIFNLLDNAVKYSPGGTKIMIRVNILVSYVFIEVEDEGIGIPKSEYADIFKRFYRGRGAAVLWEEGAGVGLYLVRKILEEQGGSVRAIKAPGGGTIMQMMLPKKYEV